MSRIAVIGAGAWGLFPNEVVLKGGETYTAHLKAGVCDLSGNCTKQDLVWKFTVSKDAGQGNGDTSIPQGFTLPAPAKSSHPANLRASGQSKGVRLAGGRSHGIESAGH